MDTWQMIKTERASLVEALGALPESEWTRPTMCTDWTVRDVVGHLISTATLTPVGFFGKLLASRFSFATMTRNEIRRHTEGATPAQLVARLAERTDARTAPPGPALSWLGETIVHGEDIFRAQGTYRSHPVEHVVAVADFYTGSNLLIGSKSRIEGVQLRASDSEWQHGTGPEVEGTTIALLMAMTGRKAALEDLSGDGVAVLRQRR
jgi:uncharacterized protein (TIGR03083 family)